MGVMKQIAVLFEGDINQQSGVFNTVISRVKHLQQIADYKIDTYMFQVYDGWLMRLARRSKKVGSRPDEIEVDGVKIHVTWFRRRWSDAIMHRLFKKSPRAMLRRLHRLGWEMRGHDLVTAHDRIAGHAAAFASEQLHIPCFITWHGSSIHTQPAQDAIVKFHTIKLLQSATCNFFVSQELLNRARRELTDDFPARVLHNGAGTQFSRYSDDKRAQLLKKYHADDGSRVVAYVGRFEPVKNVRTLPEIFNGIAHECGQKVTFWAIGSGSLLEETRQLMRLKGVDCHFFGNVDFKEMPDLLNCVDLIVLPSIEEGMPLVPIEGISCGARVVASDVGGTAEIIGKDNVVKLDGHFVENLTQRAVELLNSDISQEISPEFSWEATAVTENQIYQQYLNHL